MKPKFDDYPLNIRPLSEEEGGGILVTFPDLPGCMADGETPEEAIADARGAFDCWMTAHIEDGRPIPEPGGALGGSGKFITRVPKSLHAKLATRAKQEGVSLKSLVLSFIAEGLGRRESHQRR